MNETPSEEQIAPEHGRFRLWHGFAAVAVLSVLFGVLVELNMTAAIVVILVALVFFGIQALLLMFVMRWLKSQSQDGVEP